MDKELEKVTVDDLIIKGDFNLLNKLQIVQHIALIGKFPDHDVFRAEFNEATLQNVAKYTVLVPEELAMKIWKTVAKAFPYNSILLHQSIVEHPLDNGKMVYVGEHLTKILTDIDNKRHNKG